MNKFLKLFLCSWLLLVPCFFVQAADFGLIIDQNVGVGGVGSENDFDYAGAIIPRLSGLIGDVGDFYISASVEVDYLKKWSWVPELLRTDVYLRSGNLGFRIGRMYYSDPLGYVAEGLFDGVNLTFDTDFGTFNAGGWYTGLLYKNRAKIFMTAKDLESGLTPVDFDDFADTYFASRRVVAGLGWEHLGMVGSVKGKVSFLGQFDLNDGKKLNSQYLVGKLTVPAGSFAFDVGACLELIQNDGDFGMAIAGDAGVSWVLPTSIRSKLSLLGRFASGGTDGDTILAFLPVSTKTQGNILKPALSGISMIDLDYIARLHETFSLGLSSSYFIRSDLGTYGGYPVLGTSSDGYFLGNEFFLRLLWVPVSDFQFNLGGGMFLPALGNVASSADPLWRVELNVIISLF